MLREFEPADLPMALELSTDAYAPLVGTLPAHATPAEAADWLARQRRRWAEGAGFSFAVAETGSGRAVGQVGLWLSGLAAGRATAGYSVAPSARGRGIAAAALTAVTAFGWTIPQLHRIELHIEPWNTASVRTAERAGYVREGLLRRHSEIAGERRDMLLYAAVREDPAPAAHPEPRTVVGDRGGSTFGQVVLGVTDLERAVAFWRQALALELIEGGFGGCSTVLAPAGNPAADPKLALHTSVTAPQSHPRLHLDLHVRDAAEQVTEVERLVALGAGRVDWDGYPDDPDFVVLADPDGNLFCVVDLTHDAG